MSITRINEFHAAEGLADDLHTFLGTLVPYITSSPGCISCQILREIENQDAFVVIERWESVESHQASIESFPKEEMQAAMPLLGRPPTGTYYQS